MDFGRQLPSQRINALCTWNIAYNVKDLWLFQDDSIMYAVYLYFSWRGFSGTMMYSQHLFIIFGLQPKTEWTLILCPKATEFLTVTDQHLSQYWLIIQYEEQPMALCLLDTYRFVQSFYEKVMAAATSQLGWCSVCKDTKMTFL